MTELPAKTKTARITPIDVEQVAQLVAKRITETGACLILGINPKVWWVWKNKQKNTDKFNNLFVRIREAKLNACIEAIDKSGDDSEITIQTSSGTKTIDRKGDWRAKAWLAERVLAPDRLGDKQSTTGDQSPILGDIAKALALALKRVEPTPVDVQTVSLELSNVDRPIEIKEIDGSHSG